MTENVHVAVLPALSVAVLVTTVVPTGKVDPDGGTETTVTLEQLSVAVTVNVTFPFEHCPASAFAVMLDGHCITGFVVSRMITCWAQVVIRFPASVAFHVIVVVPTGYGAFSASASLRVPVTVTPTVVQLSVAVGGVIVTFALEHAIASAARSIVGGQMIPGD